MFYSSLFYLPQYFQVALGYSAVRSGVFLLPVLVSQTLASFITVSTFKLTKPYHGLILSLQGQMISRTGRYRVCSFLHSYPTQILTQCLAWCRLTFTAASPSGPSDAGACQPLRPLRPRACSCFTCSSPALGLEGLVPFCQLTIWRDTHAPPL